MTTETNEVTENAEAQHDEGQPRRIEFTNVDLRIDGKPLQMEVTTEEPIKLDARDASRARRALSHFIEDCEREAVEAWDEGRSGYLGRIKFSAFVDDDGLTLRVERSIAEDL